MHNKPYPRLQSYLEIEGVAYSNINSNMQTLVIFVGWHNLVLECMWLRRPIYDD